MAGYRVGGTVDIETGDGGERLVSRTITAIGTTGADDTGITFEPAFASGHDSGAAVNGSGNSRATVPETAATVRQVVGAGSPTRGPIQRLEKAGFVRRVRSTSDKRSVLVEPTAASQALRRQVEDLWARLEDYATGDLTATEREKTLDALERLEANLAAHAGDPEPPSSPGAPDA
ncbi:MarR family winged helix-turn-helix transcriptional regulator [Streptomyces massasporeus]